MRHRFRNWWLSVSIRRKMVAFIGMVVFMVLSVTLFSVGMVSLYLRDFNVVLGDSYAVNAALDSFAAEYAAFQSYASYDTPELENAYREACIQAAQDMERMHYDYFEMEVRRYLETRSILISYDSFTQECRQVLDMKPNTGAYITKYYYALKIGKNIQGYLNGLLQMTVAQGNDTYYEKVRIFQILPVIALLMGLAVILFASLLCSVTMRHILNPVLKLARAARDISARRFDLPDVQVSNRDEIGELVYTFNSMKRSMSQSITALQEKNEMEWRLHQEEVHRINTQRELKTMQMSLLQSQINPHFLFNTLNTVSRMAKIEGAENTEELIQRLANLFRYNLQTAGERVSLTRELNIINDYIYIQHLRFGNRIGFEVDCRVDPNVVMIPTFTLQPLVENAVIHGVSPKEEGGRIRIRICPRKTGGPVITVTDSGGGMPPERLELLMNAAENRGGHLSGIGIGNVRTRVEMLYPGSSFHIFSRVGLGTSIRIRLPVQPDNEETEEIGCIRL